jgi:mRNA interferase MazF
MISSQLNQEIPGFDEIIMLDDPHFEDSGLKVSSLIRIGRLAAVNTDILVGQIGRLDHTRLATIKQKLSKWIQST